MNTSQGRTCPLRVAKVGGSLLNWRHLPVALRRWLSEQPPACTVLIAGGGGLADVIRQADQVHGLGEEAAHVLCIDALKVTARLLATLLKKLAQWTTWDELRSAASDDRLQACVVLEVSTFLSAAESTAAGHGLPHTWKVTSDSIVAAVACALTADELVLFKSCQPPEGAPCASSPSLATLAAAGYVDPYFPIAIAGFAGSVRFVNLRSLGYDDRGFEAS